MSNRSIYKDGCNKIPVVTLNVTHCLSLIFTMHFSEEKEHVKWKERKKERSEEWKKVKNTERRQANQERKFETKKERKKERKNKETKWWAKSEKKTTLKQN